MRITIGGRSASELAYRTTRDARLESLGYSQYSDYLRSPYWATRKAQVKRLRNCRCEICASTNHLVVHHLTYNRIGEELDNDLLLLCERCHNETHEHQRASGCDLGVAHLKVRKFKSIDMTQKRKSYVVVFDSHGAVCGTVKSKRRAKS